MIVAGEFVGNGREQVVLYDRNAGQADVVGFDATGSMNLDTTNSGWRGSWDVIVAGDFVGNGREQILLYDRNAGQADVVGFDATGNMNLDAAAIGQGVQLDTMVCYKDERFDPYNASQEDLVTVNWYDNPVKRPETSLTGVSFFPGALVFDPSLHFVVTNQDHWVLAGTGLQVNQPFGQYQFTATNNRTVIGSETDRHQDSNNPPIHSPGDFERVARVFLDGKEIGTMGTFTNGGTVFTAATLNWALGLSQDDNWGPIDQITRNVFDRLG